MLDPKTRDDFLVKFRKYVGPGKGKLIFAILITLLSLYTAIVMFMDKEDFSIIIAPFVMYSFLRLFFISGIFSKEENTRNSS